MVKDGGENTNYYNITINGTVKYVVQGTSNLKYHEIEINSMDSFSRVEIFKKTEAICGTAIFYGIRFKEGKIKKTEAKKRRVEWVGDSFLVGYGNRVSIEIPPEGNPNTGFHSINQDGYFAFGAIVSRNLNADFSCVGVSGRGQRRTKMLRNGSWLPQNDESTNYSSLLDKIVTKISKISDEKI